MTNYFGFNDAENLICKVFAFNPGHRVMTLLVHSVGDEPSYFKVELEHVLYFDGPMQWTGANFTHVSALLNLPLMRKIEPYSKLPDHRLEQAIRVWSVYSAITHTNNNVIIVATRTYKILVSSSSSQL